MPSHDSVPFLFSYDLAALCAYTGASMPEGVSLGVNGVAGTYVHAARNELMEALIEQGADYVLWLDSDMRFPKDALLRLLRHRLPMVGINYAARGVPSHFIAVKKVGIGSGGERLKTLNDSTGTEEVEALGFGCVLLDMKTLKDMPDPLAVPWFQNKHLGGKEWMGEDIHFCDLYRKAGNRIYVDHDLSKNCRHIGQFEFSPEHAETD